jgi:hypothetical protein
VTSTTLSAPRRAALGVALALLIAAPATADAVRWSRLDSTASVRLASGPSTWVTETNIKRTSGLAPESWWGNDLSWNRYAYVENNPVNATDPTGELAMLGTALIGGLVDFSFQVAINAMEGKTGGELLEGTGKAFVRGAIIGATGYGLARVGARALEVGQAARRAQKVRAAAAMRTAQARQLGQAGEAAAEIVKNTTRIPSASGTARYRIADVLNSEARLIGEVKNVGRLSYTNQLRDFVSYAEQVSYRFELTVRQGTRLSGPLQRAVDAGQITLLRTLP